MIPYSRQIIHEDDIQAVVSVLKSDMLTQGEKVPEFETAISKFCGASYAVAVNSGTSALHLACLALGLSDGDWLWTTPITFVASANCGLYCGAKIDFVDIDPESGLISMDALKRKLMDARDKNRLPRVLIPVHFAGQSCDMAAISDLSKEFGFKIIEDACHALGASYQSEVVGSCKFSDITVFSLHPVKIITSGEGGLALTNNDEYAQTMQKLRTHGISSDCLVAPLEQQFPWSYEQHDLGFNYRLSDIHAALGLSQLSHLPSFVAERNDLAEFYNDALKDFPVTPLAQNPQRVSSYHLYVILLDEALVSNKVAIFEFMRNSGYGVNVHYIPVHFQPYYKKVGFTEGQFEQAECFYKRALTIPLYPTMTQEQQREIVACLGDAINQLGQG